MLSTSNGRKERTPSFFLTYKNGSNKLQSELLANLKLMSGVDFYSVVIRDDFLFSQKKTFLFNNYPESWMDTYFRYNLFESDNILKTGCTSSAPIEFIWDKSIYESLGKHGDLAKSLGMSYGISFGFSIFNNMYSVVSFSGSSENAFYNESNLECMRIGKESMVSCILNNSEIIKSMNLSTTIKKTGLSVVERDILRYSADGLTSETISSRVFLTKSGVEYHLLNITKKLNCLNKVQAVARAIKLGII